VPWGEAIANFPRYDFHHLPAYVSLEADRNGARGCAFFYQDGRGTFMAPFMEIPVPLTLRPKGPPLFDALAPYGYAGPLLDWKGSRDDALARNAFVAEAIHKLIQMLHERGVCSFLSCLHPLIDLPLEPFQASGILVTHGETVWCDIHHTTEQLWSETRRDFRNPINRMMREGFRFEIDETASLMPEFVRLYHETMRRVGAEARYFFSLDYFQGFKSALGDRCVLANVRNPAGTLVSSGIFTRCSGIVQYHLSGNSVIEGGSHASKLLLHGIRGWAKEQGLDMFHLGGGVGAKNDSLFLFKSGFSSNRANFRTWRVIVNEQAFASLTAQWEKLNRTGVEPVDGFFPAYRKIISPWTLHNSVNPQETLSHLPKATLPEV